MGSLLRRLREVLKSHEPSLAGEEGKLHIRSMKPKDLDAVWAIERASFGSPWRRSTYEQTILAPGHNFFVAELGGVVVGYFGFWVEGPEAHIAKLAVHQDYRRRGIGTALLREALDDYEYLRILKRLNGLAGQHQVGDRLWRLRLANATLTNRNWDMVMNVHSYNTDPEHLMERREGLARQIERTRGWLQRAGVEEPLGAVTRARR